VDPAAADFIDRVNQYYYDLSREGLRSFQCDIEISTSSVNTAKDGQRQQREDIRRRRLEFLGGSIFKLTENPGVGEAPVSAITPVFLKSALGMIKLWGLYETQPLINPDLIDFELRRIPKGFQVLFSRDGDNTAIDYDEHDLITRIRESKEQFDFRPTFELTRHGPVMVSEEIKSNDGSSIKLNCHYAEIKGFSLPDRIDYTVVLPSGQMGGDLSLSNFSVRGTPREQLGNALSFDPPGTDVKRKVGHFFWRVRSESSMVYLLGSVHMRPDEPLRLPAAVGEAYRSADYVGFETDLSTLEKVRRSVNRYLMAHLLYPEGDELSKHLSQVQWDAVKNLAMEYGLAEKNVSRMTPGGLSMALENLEYKKVGWDPDDGVDNLFYHKAKMDKKPTFGLEFWWKGYDALFGIPIADQVALLQNTVEESRRTVTEFPDLMRAWEEGETSFFETHFESNPSARVEYDRIVVGRTQAWVSQLRRILAGHANYFVVVGTMHLIGPSGLPALLKGEGYKVDQL